MLNETLHVFLIFIAIFLAFAYYYVKHRRYFHLGNKIPGPTAIPIIGNIFEAIEVLTLSPEQLVIRALDELTKTYETFPEHRIIRGWFGSQLLIFILNPADAESILSSQIHIDKADEYQMFKPWLGDGLLISTGEKWRTHRKLIAPAFHMNVLKSFVDIFNKNSQMVTSKMRKEIGRTFDVHEYMSGITVDILLETVMGMKKTSADDGGLQYATAVMKMCEILHRRHYKFWLRPKFIFKFTKLARKQLHYLGIIHNLTNEVIQIKKEEYKQNLLQNKPSYFRQVEIQAEIQDQKEARLESHLVDDLDEMDENDVGEKKRVAFLDLLIETAETTGNLSDLEIKEEVNTIMFEGHDTTAAGSSFVLSLLGVYQDVQNRVYQELRDLFGNSTRPITYLDTLEMKYLERVILETLRLYPPVPVIARKLNEELNVASGYTLPTGATVLIGIYGIHRNPAIYTKPNTFDPDNFLPERMQERHYYSFIPFSAGPRSCVGRKYAMLKMKILLATILRHYRVISDISENEFRLQGGIILKRADGFRIRIEERRN